MLIPLSSIVKVFEDIHQNSLNFGTTVWILVSYDTDSICASIILTSILKSEGILYKIIPIRGYREIST